MKYVLSLGAAAFFLAAFNPSAKAIDPKTGVRLKIELRAQGIPNWLSGREAEWIDANQHRIVGVRVTIDENIPGLIVRIRGHAAFHGDLPFAEGTLLAPDYLQGLAFDLGGPRKNDFDISYQLRLQDAPDTPIVSNGLFAGTRGQSRAMYGLVLVITPKKK